MRKLWIWRVWVALSAVGMLLPAFVLLQKLAIDPDAMAQIAEHEPAIGRMLDQARDAQGSFGSALGMLRGVAWVRVGSWGGGPYYVRAVIANAALLVVLLARKRQALLLIAALLQWSQVNDVARRTRRIALVFVLATVATWQLKLHWGFWYQGIVGWDYASYRSGLLPSAPASPESEPLLPVLHQALEGAIVDEHAARVSGAGYLEGGALLLHFNDGSAVAANDSVFGLVFPEMAWTPRFRPWVPATEAVVVSLARHTFDQARRGQSFLLPARAAYPLHSVWLPVDYRGIPAHVELVGLSWWDLVVQLEPGRSPVLINAVLSRRAGAMLP